MTRKEWKEEHRRRRCEAYWKPIQEAREKEKAQREANLRKNWQEWHPYVISPVEESNRCNT